MCRRCWKSGPALARPPQPREKPLSRRERTGAVWEVPALLLGMRRHRRPSCARVGSCDELVYAHEDPVVRTTRPVRKGSSHAVGPRCMDSGWLFFRTALVHTSGR